MATKEVKDIRQVVIDMVEDVYKETGLKVEETLLDKAIVLTCAALHKLGYRKIQGGDK